MLEIPIGMFHFEMIKEPRRLYLHILHTNKQTEHSQNLFGGELLP